MSGAARVLRPEGRSRFLLICDHASNYVPTELNDLGLGSSDLGRHIAWDIGAAGVTEVLSEMLDATAVLSGASRLVVDCNRHPDARELVPEMSDGTLIPGNVGLDDDARALRIASWFAPYHDLVERMLEGRSSAVLVSVHTMTASLSARPGVRPQVALSSYEDRSLAEPMLEFLRGPGDVTVGDNEPYDLDPAIDYSTPFHALRRGLPHLQVEFRQDEVGDTAGQRRWATRFAEGLRRLKLPCEASSSS